jgi:hypothetical protein
MYDHEQPTFALLNAHIDQMNEALRLIDVLLQETPYRPGAPWIASLPLDGEVADRTRDLLNSAADKASIVRVYATHIHAVLSEVRAAPGGVLSPAGVPGAAVSAIPVSALPGYRSLSDALAHVNPGLVVGGVEKRKQEVQKAFDVANQRYAALSAAAQPDQAELDRAQAEVDQIAKLKADLEHPIGPADLQNPENAAIVKDAVDVASVAMRLAVEAVSLATVVALEAASLAQQSPASWFQGPSSTAQLVAALPAEVRETYAHLARYAADLKQLIEQLKINPLDSIGFKFKEGLVDDVVGLAWDSVHVDLNGGGEALFYNALADDEKSTDSSGNTYDYTGRQTRLEYAVQPIVLAHLALTMKVDWAHWADAAGLKLDYATNRVYKSGGDIGNTSLANELGVTGAVSEALSAALAVAGVKASGRIAHFNHGTVRDILVTDGTLLADAPLTFDMKELDVGYDFAPRHGSALQTLTLGFRYFDYTLPRILYEFVNSTPGADTAAYVFSRETPPQAIRTRFYMIDFATRLEKSVTPHLAPYVNLDFAVGYGPTQYYFLRDSNGDDVPSNQDHGTSNSVGTGLAGSIGFRWKLGSPESRFNAYLDANYHAQLLSSLFDSKNGGDTVVNVGTRDLFHGPSAAFGAAF